MGCMLALTEPVVAAVRRVAAGSPFPGARGADRSESSFLAHPSFAFPLSALPNTPPQT